MGWRNSGRITNPIAGQILLDTGPLITGQYHFLVYGAANANAAFEFQWRNALNTATLGSQIFAVAGFGSTPPFEIPRDFYIQTTADNERFRIEMVNAVTGAVSVSMITNA